MNPTEGAFDLPLDGVEDARSNPVVQTTTLIRVDSCPFVVKESYPEFRDQVAAWIEEIKHVWARGSSRTLELAQTVWTVRKALRHGQWEQVSKSLPFSKRKANMLARIGQAFPHVDEQTFAHLPSGWSILYQLAQLPRGTFEALILSQTIHPGMTLREAKQLLTQSKGRRTALAPLRPMNVQSRLRRFADFVDRTLGGWQWEDRRLATTELTRLVSAIQAGLGANAES